MKALEAFEVIEDFLVQNYDTVNVVLAAEMITIKKELKKLEEIKDIINTNMDPLNAWLYIQQARIILEENNE